MPATTSLNREIPSSPSYRVYIVFHKYIIDAYYKKDIGFNNNNYNFIKTNEAFPLKAVEMNDYVVVEEKDIGSYYDPTLQQKTYMAPSAIYHIYKNGVHRGLKAIGFVEYDLVFSETFTSRNREIVSENESFITPFSYIHTLRKLYNQNSIKVRGRNAIKMIFKDYNRFFKTRHSYTNYLDSVVTSQQSFMCDVQTFDRVMGFITHIIESKRCEGWFTGPRPSTLLDRYIAVALLLDASPIIENPLRHKSHHEW